MGKGKLAKFADMASYENVFQYPYSVVEHVPFEMQGHWHEQYFHNQNPIVLELGCGKGEYTVGLAKMFPDVNFIGVDIKGARLWRGAKTSNEEQMKNVAFIRTRIELIDRFFAEGEVSEIWITFCDPQLKKPNKRLTSPRFLDTYSRFLAPGSTMHLKTDSQELYDYTLNEVLPTRNVEVLFSTNDLYHTDYDGEAKLTQTFYEKMFLEQGMPITYIQWKNN